MLWTSPFLHHIWFNIDVNYPDSPYYSKFSHILFVWNLKKHIYFSTHFLGNILDLLITPAGSSHIIFCTANTCWVTIVAFLLKKILLYQHQAQTAPVVSHIASTRKWTVHFYKNLTATNFLTDFENTSLPSLFTDFREFLITLLEKRAPSCTIKCYSDTKTWITLVTVTMRLKQENHQLQRIWKREKTPTK